MPLPRYRSRHTNCAPQAPQRRPRFAAATHDEVEALHAHARHTLTAMRFLNPDNPRRLMARLRRLFGRAALEREEVNILRGILARIDEFVGKAGKR
jgi:tRNA/rRNA methyltransferase